MKLRKFLYRLRSTEYLMKRTTRNLEKLKAISEDDKTNELFMIQMDNLYLLEALMYNSNDRVFLNRVKKMLEESLTKFEEIESWLGLFLLFFAKFSVHIMKTNIFLKEVIIMKKYTIKEQINCIVKILLMQVFVLLIGATSEGLISFKNFVIYSLILLFIYRLDLYLKIYKIHKGRLSQ